MPPRRTLSAAGPAAPSAASLCALHSLLLRLGLQAPEPLGHQGRGAFVPRAQVRPCSVQCAQPLRIRHLWQHLWEEHSGAGCGSPGQVPCMVLGRLLPQGDPRGARSSTRTRYICTHGGFRAYPHISVCVCMLHTQAPSGSARWVCGDLAPQEPVPGQ